MQGKLFHLKMLKTCNCQIESFDSILCVHTTSLIHNSEQHSSQLAYLMKSVFTQITPDFNFFFYQIPGNHAKQEKIGPGEVLQIQRHRN